GDAPAADAAGCPHTPRTTWLSEFAVPASTKTTLASWPIAEHSLDTASSDQPGRAPEPEQDQSWQHDRPQPVARPGLVGQLGRVPQDGHHGPADDQDREPPQPRQRQRFSVGALARRGARPPPPQRRGARDGEQPRGNSQAPE